MSNSTQKKQDPSKPPSIKYGITLSRFVRYHWPSIPDTLIIGANASLFSTIAYFTTQPGVWRGTFIPASFIIGVTSGAAFTAFRAWDRIGGTNPILIESAISTKRAEHH